MVHEPKAVEAGPSSRVVRVYALRKHTDPEMVVVL